MSVKSRIKPASGFSHFIHIVLTILLPIFVFVFVRLGFIGLATLLVVLSKWRMFAVKPRHWPANVRTNAVDLIVGLSTIIFMSQTNSQSIQLIWVLAYAMWLLFIKPRSDILGVSSQALIAQFAGLSAIFINWGESSALVLVILSWAVCYSVARHFLTSFDEPLTRYLSDMWGYFAAAVTWVLSHWLLFYGLIAQPTILLTVVAVGLTSVYYLDQTDKLTPQLKRQIIFVMYAIIIIIITFSDWGDKAI